uniref:Uncharacterized protein n=1 Tax=Ditylenchus dipsaci TaxID=166011 RepID=A0A915EQC0_9BILA
MRLTLRATAVTIGHEHFEEQLLLHGEGGLNDRSTTDYSNELMASLPFDPYCKNLRKSDSPGVTKEKLYHDYIITRGEIFCLFGYAGPRTTNHAESYHSKQRNHFSKNSKLANWVISFREVTNKHGRTGCQSVYEGKQPGRRQAQGYVEITESIMEAQNVLLQYLSSDAVLLRDEAVPSL